MDAHLFLASERFDRHFETLKDEYEKAAVRRPYLAGKSYPEEVHGLTTLLDEMFLSTGCETPIGRESGEVTGILAPHIDYGRGKDVYCRVYPFLKGADKPLIIIFGTSHGLTDSLLNISTKAFATPLGVIPCSAGLCELIREDKVLKGCVHEWPHRAEHSIELQLPLIQFLTAGRTFEILPILTGSMHRYIAGNKSLSDEEIEAPLQGLRDALKAYGKPYLIIAGADLAHIGAQFGDPYPLDKDVLARSRETDETILSHVKNVDAAGFFESVKMEKDRRRICGLTSIYIQLSLLAGSECEIIDYGQWTDGRSSVSFAGAVFYACGSRKDAGATDQ
jgi:AmmeMemoRadiSam system protein B